MRSPAVGLSQLKQSEPVLHHIRIDADLKHAGGATFPIWHSPRRAEGGSGVGFITNVVQDRTNCFLVNRLSCHYIQMFAKTFQLEIFFFFFVPLMAVMLTDGHLTQREVVISPLYCFFSLNTK